MFGKTLEYPANPQHFVNRREADTRDIPRAGVQVCALAAKGTAGRAIE
jgi:hypothetical protein